MRRLFRAAWGVSLVLTPLIEPGISRAAQKSAGEDASPAAHLKPRKQRAAVKRPPKRRRVRTGRAPFIRRIRVVRRDVFDTNLRAEDKKIFRLINALHVTTKESAIKGLLLLKEGDRYNADLAKESERALRNILLLRNVRVTPIPINDRTVDLLVTTQDTWTTEPQFGLTGVGQTLNLKTGLRERNLFGYGKAASFYYKKTDGVITRTYSYNDPLFLGTPMVMGGSFQDRADGTTRSLSLAKPFSASVTHWSAGGALSNDKHEEKELDNLGNEIGRFRVKSKDSSVYADTSILPTTRRVFRPGVGYERSEVERIRLSSGRTESDELFHIAHARLDVERIDFLTVDHINQYGQDEDFALGPALIFDGGAARHKWVPTSDNANFYKGTFQEGTLFGTSHFALLTLGGNGEFQNGTWRSSHAQADLNYYNHFQPRQTLAAHLGWAAIVNPTPTDNILLGGDTGMRAYKMNQFAGNKKLLANVEDRFFVIDDVGRFASVGAVVFSDAGYVWAPGKDIRMSDVKSDVGVGLRLHLNRTSLGHVLRFDLAYAMRRVGNQPRLVFSFGTAQAF